MIDRFEILEQFRDHARSLGIELPAIVRDDGELHRCGTTEKPHKYDAAYLLHLDDSPTGMLQNFAAGMEEMEPWKPRAIQASPAERREWKERAEAAKVKSEAEQALREANAAKETMALLRSSRQVDADGAHPYLARKGIRAPYGIMVDGNGDLLVPLMEPGGIVTSLQRISSDGSKKFFPGGRIKGCCFWVTGRDLVEEEPAILVCEGLATAATAHQASSKPSVMAINAGNLMAVALSIRARFPKATIVLCADDDHATVVNGKPTNVGVIKAKAAALAVGGVLLVPRFPASRGPKDTDLNDLAKLAGIAEVVNQIDAALIAGPYVEGQPTHPGVPEVEPEPSSRGIWVNSAKRLRGGREDRRETGKSVLPFGVRYLDDALVGIKRDDIILLGAAKGTGKTQLATNIALTNLYGGKRVHLFGLEADSAREIEYRILFQFVSRLYFKSSGEHRRGPDIRYLEWELGKLDDRVGQFEEQAERDAAVILANMHTFYKQRQFTAEDFAEQVNAIANKTDLIVLDHFQCMDNDDPNELRGSKRMLDTIEQTVREHRVPIIIIGHLRKLERRTEAKVPSSDDFFGSSALTKQCTKAVIVAKDYDRESGSNTLSPTYMRIVKSRPDSNVERYCASLDFDITTGKYAPTYILGRLSKMDSVFTALCQADCPTWKSEGSNWRALERT